MTTKRIVFIGGMAGLFVPVIALTLLAFGLPSDIIVGNVNVTHLLWPSYGMLIVGWHSTIKGIMITLIAVAINCLIYVAVVFLMRFGVIALKKAKP